MLPDVGNFDDLLSNATKEQENTLTFGINLISEPINYRSLAYIGKLTLGLSPLGAQLPESRIRGKVEGLVALRQSIYLMLSIEADQYIIYPYTYGVNTLDLIGKPSYYVTALLPERIRETLLKDDRILDVSDFEFEVKQNKVHATFTVHTIYGDVNEEKVVSY